MSLTKQQILWQKVFGAAVKVQDTLKAIDAGHPEDQDVRINLEQIHVIFEVLIAKLVLSKRIMRPPGDVIGS